MDIQNWLKNGRPSCQSTAFIYYVCHLCICMEAALMDHLEVKIIDRFFLRKQIPKIMISKRGFVFPHRTQVPIN